MGGRFQGFLETTASGFERKCLSLPCLERSDCAEKCRIFSATARFLHESGFRVLWGSLSGNVVPRYFAGASNRVALRKEPLGRNDTARQIRTADYRPADFGDGSVQLSLRVLPLGRSGELSRAR